MAAVREMIFRDKIDVCYDPRNATRRRRIEWPTADNNVSHIFLQGTNTPAKEVTAAARDLINEGFITEFHIYNELFVKNLNWRQILRALYWRARRQSTIWDVFELLVDRGVV